MLIFKMNSEKTIVMLMVSYHIHWKANVIEQQQQHYEPEAQFSNSPYKKNEMLNSRNLQSNRFKDQPDFEAYNDPKRSLKASPPSNAKEKSLTSEKLKSSMSHKSIYHFSQQIS